MSFFQRTLCFGLLLAAPFGLHPMALANNTPKVQSATPVKAEQIQPIVVMVKADWCPACTKIDPALQALMKDYEGKAQFVVLDVTNKKTVASTLATVKALGLNDFYQTYGSRTGTVAFLHPQNKKVLKTFMAESRLKKYEEALLQATQSISS